MVSANKRGRMQTLRQFLCLYRDVSTKPVAGSELPTAFRIDLVFLVEFRSTFDHVVYNDLFPGARKIGTERLKLAVTACDRSF